MGVAALLSIAAPSVLAEPVLSLEGPVTDPSGVLAGSEGDITDAIERTLDEHGVQVFVLFVNSTDGISAAEYAAQTAATNSLGVDDALLLVAVEDRTDYIWLSDGLDEITDDELDAIIGDTLEPALRGGEFGAAAIATVEALGDAAASGAPTAGPIVPGPGSTASPADPGTDGASGGIGLAPILGAVLLAGGGYLLFRRWRASAKGGAAALAPGAASAPAPTGPELARRANTLLIATDERIRDAKQEVDFAEAQYGAEEVTPLRKAVASAQEELREAFTVRQQLDDDVPEDAATRDAMLRQIVERTTRAQAMLDQETGRIRKLRDLERDAPATLVELPARIEAVEDRMPGARATVAGLQRYAQAAWEPVAGDVEEAEKGLAGARNAVIVGSGAMSRDDRSEVAIATREALEGVTGAAALLDAIDKLAADIDEAGRRVPEELREAERDLGEARAALAGDRAAEAGGGAGLSGQIGEAERALETARRAAGATPADPIDALRMATEAHRLADELLVAAREAADARARLVTAVDSTIRTAGAEVDRAATFIASRRRGVGDTARTRLAEANRLVAEASTLETSDPARALETARRAQSLAQEAFRLAQTDFDDWDQGGPGWGQRTGSGDETAEILGQILGGVLGGVIRGGGGGWGGSPWGSGGRGAGGGLGGLGGGVGRWRWLRLRWLWRWGRRRPGTRRPLVDNHDDNDVEGETTPWHRLRSSGALDSSSAPTSTPSSTTLRIRSRCWTSSSATSRTTSPRLRKRSPRRSATCDWSRTTLGRLARHRRSGWTRPRPRRAERTNCAVKGMRPRPIDSTSLPRSRCDAR